MTIKKYPPTPDITRPILAKDVVIETSALSTTFNKTQYVKSGNYLIQSSEDNALKVIGSGISIIASSSPQIVNASSDGSIVVSPYEKPISFTPQNLLVSTTWNQAAFGNSGFVILAGSTVGVSYAIQSTNGISWTSTNTPINSWWSTVHFSRGSYVAATFGFSYAASSTNGITWTQRTMPVTANWNNIVSSSSSFVAVAGGTSSYAASSTDGITWVLRTLPYTGSSKPLAYDGTRFVTINAVGSQVAVSTDGITWTQSGTVPITGTATILWNSMVYGNGRFIATQGSATGTTSNIVISTNGTTWTSTTFPINIPLGRIVFGSGLFTIFTSGSDIGSSIIGTSTDGITWTTYQVSNIGAAGAAHGQNKIVYSNISVAGSSSLIATSFVPLPEDDVTFGMYTV